MSFNNRNSFNQPTHELKLVVSIKNDKGESVPVTLGYLGLFNNNDIHDALINNPALVDQMLSTLTAEVQEAGIRGEKTKRTITFG